MSESLGTATLELRTDSNDFNKGMDSALDKAKRTADGFTRMGQRMTLGITAPFAFFANKARTMAVDAEELQSAFNFSFGKMAEQMDEWAIATGDALGRSTQSIQDQAFQFNQLFKAALQPQQAAAMSQQFTLLANDLSSFFNVTESKALEKLQSGLVGSAEPLRAFGVFLNEAAVATKGVEMGLVAQGQAMTDQQKIIARAAIIMDQTSDAQGDLARTADSAANKERALGAAFEELGVKVGKVVSEHLTPLISRLGVVVTKLSNLNPGIIQMGLAIGLAAALTGPLLITVGALITALTGLAGAFMLVVPLVTGLLLPMSLLAVALGSVLVVWAKWDQISTWLSEVYTSVKTWLVDKISPAVDWFKDKISGIAEFFGVSAETIANDTAAFAEKTADGFAQIGTGLFDFVTEAGGSMIGGLRQMGDAALALLDDSFTQLIEHPVITEGLDTIREKFRAMWAEIKDITKDGTGEVNKSVTGMGKTGEEVNKKSFGAQVAMAAGAFGQIQVAIQTHSKKAFKLTKALALAQAVVALPSAVLQSFENGGGYPWGLIPAGIMLANGLGEIAAIRSTTLNGGGGGGGGSARGGGGSVPTSPALDPVPIVSAEERNENTTTLVVDANGDEFSRVLAESLRTVADNEDIVFFGDESRQAIGA